MFQSHYSGALMAWPVEHVCELLMLQRELIVFAPPHCAL